MLKIEISAPPDPEAQRDRLYADKSGHLVESYDLGRIANDKAYFWDGRMLSDTGDSFATAIASVQGFELQVARDLGLTPLEPHLGGTAIIGHITIVRQDPWAPLCQWPYGSTVTIERDGAPSIRVMLFVRRRVPKTSHYAIDCEAGPGDIDLTMRFENVVPSVFFGPDNQALLAFDRPPAVLSFKGTGDTIGSHITPGIIAIPPEMPEKLRLMVLEGQLKAQEAIDRIEAALDEIDRK